MVLHNLFECLSWSYYIFVIFCKVSTAISAIDVKECLRKYILNIFTKCHCHCLWNLITYIHFINSIFKDNTHSIVVSVKLNTCRILVWSYLSWNFQGLPSSYIKIIAVFETTLGWFLQEICKEYCEEESNDSSLFHYLSKERRHNQSVRP